MHFLLTVCLSDCSSITCQGVSVENRRLMNKMKVYGHRELHTVSSILIYIHYGVTLLCTHAHDCSHMCPTVVDMSGMSHGVSKLWLEGYGAMQLLPSHSPTILCRSLSTCLFCCLPTALDFCRSNSYGSSAS